MSPRVLVCSDALRPGLIVSRGQESHHARLAYSLGRNTDWTNARRHGGSRGVRAMDWEEHEARLPGLLNSNYDRHAVTIIDGEAKGPPFDKFPVLGAGKRSRVVV